MQKLLSKPAQCRAKSQRICWVDKEVGNRAVAGAASTTISLRSEAPLHGPSRNFADLDRILAAGLSSS